MTRSRSVLWAKDDPYGSELADVTFGDGRLSASGVALGVEGRRDTEGDPWRLEYQLETGADYVTSRLAVTIRGQGWTRSIDLRRAEWGAWSGAGLEPDALLGALDCDLALSPMTNTMPVLRHGLFHPGASVEIVTAWVSVPDLTVSASRQRYSFREKRGDLSVIHFELADGSFEEDIVFDADGLVVDYPGIAWRVSATTPQNP
jgi:hypothetical protein